jgi:hypothetical protein
MSLVNSAKDIVQNDFGGPAIMSRWLGFRPVALRPRLSTGLPFRSSSFVQLFCITRAKGRSVTAVSKILLMILERYLSRDDDDGWNHVDP